MKIELKQNVMYGGEHHAAGEIVDIGDGVAEQLLAQGLGVEATSEPAADESEPSEAESAGPATSEPEPQGKEQAKAGLRAKSGK